MELQSKIKVLQLNYIEALRCWQTNNLRSCLSICDNLTRDLDTVSDRNDKDESLKLKQLVRFLKIRCLADEYYSNESLLLHEDDIEGNSDDQVVRVYSGARVVSSRAGGTVRTRTVATRGSESTTTTTRGRTALDSRVKTGILTGRAPSAGSRQGSQGRSVSSYRPLTTSLTASQTAFSRSTRPLLKYSTNKYLAKSIYEYLYNAQVATNKCPDYRQCLEYLNLVQSSCRMRSKLKFAVKTKVMGKSNSSNLVSLDDDESDENNRRRDSQALGVYWLISFGICYYNLHMHKQAEEYFQSASSVDPNFLDCYTWLIKVYLITNQPANVLKTCRIGLSKSKSPLLYNWMARVQSLMGDLYAANLSLRSSLSYYPTNIEALSNVGYFAFYSDKLEQSLKCFERIQQLTYNRTTTQDSDLGASGGSTAQLLNNLATCYFYNGDHHKVLPLFFEAFLSSPNKEVTSDIWYNMSFVPLSFGFKNLAMACLHLALKNNSQNEEAMNNLGVLKFGPMINGNFDLHFENRQEFWGSTQTISYGSEVELKNATDHKRCKSLYDEAESYFRPPNGDTQPNRDDDEFNVILSQPEMMYNMAILKRARGELLKAVIYGNMYLDKDPNNYSIRSLLREIHQLVAHDA